MLDTRKRAKEEVEDRIIWEWAKQERKAMKKERERREQSCWRKINCFN